MKLTSDLKDKVEAVETQKERNAIIEEGIELTEEELEGVAGGHGEPDSYIL